MYHLPAMCMSMTLGDPRLGPRIHHKILKQVCSDRQSLAVLPSVSGDCGAMAHLPVGRPKNVISSSWTCVDDIQRLDAKFICLQTRHGCLPPSASKIEASFSRHCLRTNLQGFGPICLTTRLRTLHHICHEAQEEDVVVRQSVAAEDRKHLQGKDPLVVGGGPASLVSFRAHEHA